VKSLLPDSRMRLIEVVPGRCLAVFTAFEYRATDIGPYNELSIAFPVKLERTFPGLDAARQFLSNRYSAYVWQLPVTTEVARRGGIEFYGFPKFLADIEFEDREGHRECRLSEDGVPILSLKGRHLHTKKGPFVEATTYSVMEGITIHAKICTDALEFGQSLKPDAAELTLADHPLADALRKLGLSQHPLLYQYCPLTEAILFGGRNLMECR